MIYFKSHGSVSGLWLFSGKAFVLRLTKDEKKGGPDPFLIIFSTLFFAGLLIIGIYFVQVMTQKASEKFIRDLARVNDAPDTPQIVRFDSEGIEEWVDLTDQKNKSKINFWGLQSTNPDIIAWIEIPDSPVQYPILKATEEEGEDYYLRRDYTGKKNNHGSIFIRTCEPGDFSEQVTVIYGHNMKDGSMFAWLHKLQDENFSAKYPDLNIYTPDRNIKAKFLACYTTDTELVNDKFHEFRSAQDRMNYIYTFDNKSTLCDLKERDIVNGKERLITLSTCTEQGEKRVLAQYIITEEEFLYEKKPADSYERGQN